MSDSKFNECLRYGRVRHFSRGPDLVEKELENAQLDLKAAKESLQKENYKWAIIQTYYSMFHAARGLLYSRGYREKSHQCLIEAIRNFYVEKGEIGFWLVETLQEAKTLRENADYYGEFNQTQAKMLIQRAKEFLQKSREVL